MKAVIDRIENDLAILLVGDQEIQVDIPVSLLPDGAKEGSWLTIDMKLDLDAEQQQRKKISGMLERLKNKNNEPK